MKYCKLMIIEQYFHSNGPDFKRDAKYNPIIERIEKDSNIKSTLEKQEDKWMKHLLTYVPFEFDMELVLYNKICQSQISI